MHIYLKIVFSFFLPLLIVFECLAQEENHSFIQFDSTQIRLDNLMKIVEENSDYDFSYNAITIDGSQMISLRKSAYSIDELLNVLHENDIKARIRKHHIILKKVEYIEEPVIPEYFTISGNIKNSENGEDLIGASIAVLKSGKGCSTNSYGFFSLTIQNAESDLVFSYVGYESLFFSFNLKKDTSVTIFMNEKINKLTEITVIFDEISRLKNDLQSGRSELPLKSMKKMSGAMGETDVIKSLQSLPGVQFFSDGSTIFNVRGGGRDQNLLMIDDAPVYNPAHLLGIFSVFTPDALNSVQIYKGDMPASYGGRLSSVVDVRMKEGNKNKFTFSGNTGLVATSLTMEAPLLKKRGSFLLSGRKSHLKWILSQSAPSLKELYFTDFNLKTNIRLNKANRLFFSMYSGVDKIENQNRQIQSSGIFWANGAGNIRWNHVFGNRLFSNTSFIFSKYDYNLYTSFQQKNRWNAQIGLAALKSDFTFYIKPEVNMRFGFIMANHTYYPGNFLSGNKADPLIPGVPQKHALERAAYISNELKINERFWLRYGLRLSSWQNRGKSIEFVYDDANKVIDTLVYDEHERYNQFFSFEPRLSLQYSLSAQWKMKIAYTRNSQFEYLITNSISPFTSLEIWLPAGPNIKPMHSDQISGGFIWNAKQKTWYFNLEFYYKSMKNYISYVDHAYMLFNPFVENQLRYGKGKSYGAEFMLKKVSGKWNGWISYAYSRSILKIQDVNSNHNFPSNYDRPHSLSAYVFFTPKSRIELSANWIYSSGSPFTTPTGYYKYSDHLVPFYKERNNDRLPNYHRLDVSCELRLNKITAKNEHSIRLSIFNLYGRKNPFNINFNKHVDEEGNIYVPSDLYNQSELTTTMMYMYGTIPSISYHFNF